LFSLIRAKTRENTLNMSMKLLKNPVKSRVFRELVR